MLLNIGSFILIVLITAYHIFYMAQRKGMLTRTAGLNATSAFTILSGCAFGVVAGQTFDYDLSLTVAISILFGIITGFPGGIPFGWQSATNGLLVGSLGAMLGTVLGSLFFKSTMVVMTADIVFIVVIFLVQKIIDWRLNKNDIKKKMNKKPSHKKPVYTSTIILMACVTVFMSFILLQKDQIHIGSIGQPQSQKATIDEENDLQIATIDVSASGITPKKTEFKAGSMIKAIFNVKSSAGTNLKLVSKDLNINADLNLGQNTFLLNNPQPGTYEIMIPSKGYKGTFTVKAGK